MISRRSVPLRRSRQRSRAAKAKSKKPPSAKQNAGRVWEVAYWFAACQIPSAFHVFYERLIVPFRQPVPAKEHDLKLPLHIFLCDAAAIVICHVTRGVDKVPDRANNLGIVSNPSLSAAP